MTTIRRFCCDDLLRFSSVNLDHLTETVSIIFVFLWFVITIGKWAGTLSVLNQGKSEKFQLNSGVERSNYVYVSLSVFIMITMEFWFWSMYSLTCHFIWPTWHGGLIISMSLKLQETESWDTVNSILFYFIITAVLSYFVSVIHHLEIDTYFGEYMWRKVECSIGFHYVLRVLFLLLNCTVYNALLSKVHYDVWIDGILDILLILITFIVGLLKISIYIAYLFCVTLKGYMDSAVIWLVLQSCMDKVVFVD